MKLTCSIIWKGNRDAETEHICGLDAASLAGQKQNKVKWGKMSKWEVG